MTHPTAATTVLGHTKNTEMESLGIINDLDTCEDNDIDFVNPIDPDPVPDTTPPGKLKRTGCLYVLEQHETGGYRFLYTLVSLINVGYEINVGGQILSEMNKRRV